MQRTSAIIVLEIGSGLRTGWAGPDAVTNLESNRSVSGLVVDFTPAMGQGGFSFRLGNFLFRPDLGGVLAGFMVLALGAAFRQGLALKEENDRAV